MMDLTCRVLPHESADGPANMALDDSLLETVADDPRRAVFRTYEWTVPTLSLGYFQRIDEAEAEPRWRTVPIVRRPTGGGAIWHHHEVTYALVLPEGHPQARRGGTLYRAVHDAIARVLHARGVEAGRRGEGPPGVVADRPFLCFSDRDAEDLVDAGRKVVGSAQRRRRGAVLQHGSILLARSPTAPELAGIADLAGVAADADAWGAAFREHVPGALGLLPIASEASEAERRRAGELERSVYRDASWTRRR